MMSARSFLRRSIFLAVGLTSLGTAWYFAGRRPFEARRIIHELIEEIQSDGQIKSLSKNPAVIRVCEDIVADPHWWKTTEEPALHQIIEILVLARSDAAIPGLVTMVEDWNHKRFPPFAGYHTMKDALYHLEELGTPAAEAALRQLAMDFPPFPRPHEVATTVYASRGAERAILERVRLALPTYTNPSARTGEGDYPRISVEALTFGLASMPGQEATDLLWQILGKKLTDTYDSYGECGAGHFGLNVLYILRRRLKDGAFIAQFLHKLPPVAALEDTGVRFRENMVRDFQQNSKTMAGDFEQYLAEAGGDLPKIHWLKKLVLLEALRRSGTQSDLPLLRKMREDRSAFRELARFNPGDPSEPVIAPFSVLDPALTYKTARLFEQYAMRDRLPNRVEDASLPQRPGWRVIRTQTFGELAAEAEAAILDPKLRLRPE